MREILTALLLLAGGTFMLLAAVGVLRMPDLFMRMQAVTKASTLGVGCLFVGVAVYFSELGVTLRALATVVFVTVTTPVAAHMLARAAYIVGVPLWEGTRVDELKGRYEPGTRRLLGGPEEPDPGA